MNLQTALRSAACTLMLGSLHTVLAQESNAPPQAFLQGTKGQVVGLAFEARSVRNLDQAVAFYKALGFVPVPGLESPWRNDEVMNRIHGTKNVESRMAKFTIDSSVSGKPFTLYLREFRGIERRDVRGGKTTWEPAATHIGLVVPDTQALWSQLRAAGMLRPRTWDGKLVPRAGAANSYIAYLTDPDGIDVEIFDPNPAVPATGSTPARPAESPGINHVGIVTANIDLAQGFYGALLGVQFPATTMAWAAGDFLDSAVGGHGNILRLFNGTIADAADPNARLRFELVDYLNRKKPVEPFRITDIGVTYLGMQVTDIDALVARLQGAGAALASDGIVAMSTGHRVALVRDFDTGTYIELFEPPHE